MTYPFRFVSLWEMLDIDGSEVLDAFQGLATLAQVTQDSLQKSGIQLVNSSFVEFSGHVDILEKHAANLELPLSLKSIRAVKDALENCFDRGETREFSRIQIHTLHQHLSMFSRRMRDEYTTRVFLAVPYGRAKYYSDPAAFFGKAAWGAFPTHGQYEMEEACRCFALARSTAAVFHSMRLMEVAISAVRKSLGIPDPIKASKRNWGEILRLIKEEGIDPRNVKGGPGWKDPLDRTLFGEFYLLLSAVKDTWRNPTMHVENKYNEEEAENVLTAVRAFVRKVAGRMDEDGKPKA